MKFWTRKSEDGAMVVVGAEIDQDEYNLNHKFVYEYWFKSVLQGMVDKYIADHGDELLQKITMDDLAKEIPKQIGLALAAKVLASVKAN